MRFVYSLLCLLVASAGVLSGQVIDIGEATRVGEGRLAVALESSDPMLLNLMRRAFGLHGAYTLTVVEQSAFIFQVERASGASVLLTIRSGQPAQELLRRTVPGRDVEHAALRAADLAVEATLHTPGFFAGKLAFVAKQQGIAEIYTADLLFNQVRALTADRVPVNSPSWSPDGTRLLYTTYHKTGFPDIYMLDLRHGRTQAIATYKGTNFSADFSPDGRWIAMALSSPGNAEIFVADANGQRPRRLTMNKSLEASPTWSPDGRRLVFTSDARGKPQLYEIAVSGGVMRRLPTNISRYCAEPAWNPVNEDLIAFTAAVAGGFQIALYDVDAGSSRVLTSVSASAVEPEWLNDGRHLVFTQREQYRTRLMLLDVETGKVSPLHLPEFGDASSASFVY